MCARTPTKKGTRMRIGFRSDGSVRHLELAKRVGLPVIELGWTPEISVELDDIERRLKDFGIGVSAILTGEHHDLDGLKFALDWTRRLGAFAFVTHPEPIALHDTEKAREFAALFAPATEYAAKALVLGVTCVKSAPPRGARVVNCQLKLFSNW